jgi:chaperonin GroEL (HSP60 family)
MGARCLSRHHQDQRCRRDGTTTATVLAQAIVTEGKVVAAGANRC